MKHLKAFMLVFLTCNMFAGCEKNETEDVSVIFDYAFLEYYGDYYGSGTGNFDLYLYKNDGNVLYLECLSDHFEDVMRAEITTGAYVMSDDYSKFTFTGESGVFLNGYEYLITDGNFTVSRSGNAYGFSCDLTLENGETFKGSYAGTIEYELGSNLTSDLTLTSFGTGEYAEVADGAWMLFLPVTDNEFVILCINTESGLGSVPTGEFSMAQTPRQWVSGTVDPCSWYYEYESEAYGCWYLNSNNYLQSFAVGGAGHVTVSGSSPEYTIDFSFTDSNGYTVSGIYAGDLVPDYTVRSAMSAKTAKGVKGYKVKQALI